MGSNCWTAAMPDDENSEKEVIVAIIVLAILSLVFLILLYVI